MKEITIEVEGYSVDVTPRTAEERSVWIWRHFAAIKKDAPEISDSNALYLAKRALSALLEE